MQTHDRDEQQASATTLQPFHGQLRHRRRLHAALGLLERFKRTETS
jgi:hypothetical protein